MRTRGLAFLAGIVLLPGPALGTKVFLNASDQSSNSVDCGGVESTYAADNAQRAQARLEAVGFDVQYSQDFANSPSIANNWGADAFLSVHSNAGGGHGTETLYKTAAGQALALPINDALVASLTFADRGLKYRTDLHMLNATDMPAALTEVLFHDCMTNHSTPLGTMSESCFLTEPDGRAIIGEALAQGFCTYFTVSCSVVQQDAGVVQQDSGVVQQDSGVVQQDSGVIHQDGAPIQQDAGGGQTDGGGIVPDGGGVVRDGGGIVRDGGGIGGDDAALGPGGYSLGASCGCAAGSPAGPGAVLLLAVLGLVRRRLRYGNPGRVPMPSRDGTRRAKPVGFPRD